MRFLHLADLHIGKRVNEFPMTGDQRHVLLQVLRVMEDRKVDGVIIAGDVYDKAVPSAEAVGVLDWFLTELAVRKMPVYLVSGNHDSGERLAFGAKLMRRSGIHVAGVYDGTLEPVRLEDEYGALYLYLLPFVKPAYVKKAMSEALQIAEKPEEEENIQTYQDAVSYVLSQAKVEAGNRNLLVAHQLVTGATRCESEEISVGGIDNVDASLFAPFDYVALGHLHGPQNVGGPAIRYCGSPLKYSFSEADQEKSVTVVTLQGKGNVEVSTVPLEPRRDLVEIRGSYMEVTAKEYYDNLDRDAYFHITLTDEEDITDGVRRLQTVYPNLMKMDYDNARTRFRGDIEAEEEAARSPMELFGKLYQAQNNRPLSEEQKTLLQEMIEKIWGGEEE